MTTNKHIAIIGGGPSGLMAAELLATAGHRVSLYDKLAHPGRKLLMAGRGGLNLTHSEPLDIFLTRYGEGAEWLAPYIRAFPPESLRAWCENLGQETFVGSSGRVFPKSMKAAPLLRAWLRRLDDAGVRFMGQHQWLGFENGALLLTDKNQKQIRITPDATLLALGGASWPKLGSDGSWEKILSSRDVEIAPMRPANCGFTISWSDYFRERFAGQPLKPVSITHGSRTQQGEAMITAQGIEGGVIYALSASLRDSIAAKGSATMQLDLRPGMDEAVLKEKLESRGNQSLSSHLRKCGFSPMAAALLREAMTAEQISHASPAKLAPILKAFPITLTGTTGIARAISTAGGIKREAVTDYFMLRKIPGVFAAGEMLDWEAPTGGYLLQACFSTAVAAAQGIDQFLAK